MAEVKQAKPKVIPEYKIIAELFTTYFLKPNARRSSFLYTGFDVPDGYFILGSDPKYMYYGSPDQTAYIVKITNPDFLLRVKTFFSDYAIDVTRLGVINLSVLIATYIKQKGTGLIVGQVEDGDYAMSAPSLDTPKLISVKYDSLFILHQFATTIKHLIPYVGGGRNDIFSVNFPEELKEKLFRVEIPYKDFKDTFIGDKFPSILRVLLAKGLDLLLFKHLKDPPIFSGLRFWSFSGSTLKYGFCIDTPDCSILATRCNVFLIPE